MGHPGLPLAPRHWQDLGYLIIYVTGRPDMQKQRVVAWLAQHNFPHGVVSFCDGLVHDPLRHKANFLKLLISEVGPGQKGSGQGEGGRAEPTPTPVSPTAALACARGLRLHQGRGGLQLHQPVPHADLHRGPAHQEAAAAVPGEPGGCHGGPCRRAAREPWPVTTSPRLSSPAVHH